MADLLEDIKTQSDWIVRAFKADNLILDYSIRSFIQIDTFFNLHVKDGKPVPGGRLASGYGPIIFSIGAYVGETFIKVVPGSSWVTRGEDPADEINVEIKFPDGTTAWPVQRVFKRFANGSEDSVYVYGHRLTENYSNETFDSTYWKIHSGEKPALAKPWWKFW